MGKKLERYMKKNKMDPFHGDKGGKTPKGPKGVQKADQYAKTSGRKITDDAKDSAETDPASKIGTIGAYESIRGNGKKKQRPYLDD